MPTLVHCNSMAMHYCLHVVCLLPRDLRYLIIFVLLVTKRIDFSKKKQSFLPEDKRYSESMLNLFIGQLDGKMDGN